MNILKKNKGFTLIELMAVVAIIGIVAAIVFPKFSEMRQKAKEAITKGHLGICRTAIVLCCGRNEGIYPYRLSGNPPGDPLYEIEGGIADQKWGTANGSPDGIYARGWSDEICIDFMPSIEKLPENSISVDPNKTVRSGIWNEPDPGASPSGNHNGWFYCFRSGKIIVNSNDIDMKGNPYTSW